MKRVLFGFACLLAVPRATSGQKFYGFAGGLNVTRQVPVDPYPLHGSTSSGFAVQASIGRQLTGRYGWRLDAFVSQFHLTQPSDFAGVLCAYPPPAGACCGICPRDTTTHRVGVTGVAASEFVNVIPSVRGLGMYLIGGAETDYVYQKGFGYQHPSGHGELQFGVSAGLGVAVPAGDRRQIFVEARYHRLTGARLIGAPTQLTWLAPVTVGFRF